VHAHDRSDAASETRPAAARAVPLLVWAATAMFISFMVAFVFLYPPYQGFDESGHLSRVISTQHGDVTPTPTKYFYGSAIGNSYQFFSVPDQPPYVDYVAPSRSIRPSFDKLGGSSEYVVPGALPDQLAEHPPGYYLVAAGFLDAIPESSHLAWDQSVALLRLLDVLFLAPLPLICWALARRLTGPSTAVAASFAPTMVPGLARLGASVNNDDLLILLVSIFLLALAGVLDGDRRARTAVVIAASIAFALLVKGFALVLPLVAVVAYVVAARRSRERLPWRCLAIVVAGSALGGLWWLRNVVVYGAVQPAGLTPAEADRVWPPLPNGQHGSLGAFIGRAIHINGTDFWAALGLPSPPNLPPLLSISASVIVLALLVVALVTDRRRLALAVLLLPVLLIITPLLYHGWHLYYRTKQPAGVQGRYLYPAFVAIVAAVACGADHLIRRRAARFMPAIACAAALILQISAIVVVLTHFWLPHGVSVIHLVRVVRAMGEQSPWPGPLTMAMFVAAGLAALFGVGATAVQTLRGGVGEIPLVRRGDAVS
jgi:small subunit ribosomal protein S36